MEIKFPYWVKSTACKHTTRRHYIWTRHGAIPVHVTALPEQHPALAKLFMNANHGKVESR